MESRSGQPLKTPDPFEEESAYGAPSRPSRRGRYTVIAVIVLLTVAAVFVYGKWNLRSVEVRGLVNWSAEELLALAGIDRNTTYFSINEAKIARRISSNRYLEFVSLEKVWPDGLILTVNERAPAINVLYLGVQYVAAKDGMVLESSAQLALDNGCIKVTGLNVRDIRIGARIVCRLEDEMETVSSIIDELEMQQAADEIAELNLSSLESIYLVTVDGYTANIGDAQNLRGKIGTVRAVVQELRRRGLRGGMIEATVVGEASYRPLQ